MEYRAADVDRIVMKVGEQCQLESLRQAVVPPYVLIIPFVEPPAGVVLLRQDGLEEDGIHGAVFTLQAVEAGEGVLRLGFRDLREGKVVIEKSIQVIVHP